MEHSVVILANGSAYLEQSYKPISVSKFMEEFKDFAKKSAGQFKELYPLKGDWIHT